MFTLTEKYLSRPDSQRLENGKLMLKRFNPMGVYSHEREYWEEANSTEIAEEINWQKYRAALDTDRDFFGLGLDGLTSFIENTIDLMFKHGVYYVNRNGLCGAMLEASELNGDSPCKKTIGEILSYLRRNFSTESEAIQAYWLEDADSDIDGNFNIRVMVMLLFLEQVKGYGSAREL